MSRHSVVGERLNASYVGPVQQFKNLVKPVITATAEILRTVTYRLPPTPATPHYVFGIADILRVVQGLILGARRMLFCVTSHE